jgi:hypothetical protein
MEWGKQMEKHGENAKLSLYQNTNYSFERIEKKSLILDVIISDDTTFSVDLIEPMIIDKLSDIYLDSFVTHACIVNTNGTTHNHMGFVLGIDQLNIKNNTNQNFLFNKIYIPNEDNTGTNKTFVHKGKKLNYICSINPTKLSNISGTIHNPTSSLATMFHATHGRFVAEFVIVARDKE